MPSQSHAERSVLCAESRVVVATLALSVGLLAPMLADAAACLRQLSGVITDPARMGRLQRAAQVTVAGYDVGATAAAMRDLFQNEAHRWRQSSAAASAGAPPQIATTRPFGAARSASPCAPRSNPNTGSPVASASCTVKQNVSGQIDGISQPEMP